MKSIFLDIRYVDNFTRDKFQQDLLVIFVFLFAFLREVTVHKLLLSSKNMPMLFKNSHLDWSMIDTAIQ